MWLSVLRNLKQTIKQLKTDRYKDRCMDRLEDREVESISQTNRFTD